MVRIERFTRKTVQPTSYNPFDQVQFLVNDKTVYGRPCEFSDQIAEPLTSRDKNGKLVIPTKVSIQCPDCTIPLELDVDLGHPPFPILRVTCACQKAKIVPPQRHPDPFLNPILAGTVSLEFIPEVVVEAPKQPAFKPIPGLKLIPDEPATAPGEFQLQTMELPTETVAQEAKPKPKKKAKPDKPTVVKKAEPAAQPPPAATIQAPINAADLVQPRSSESIEADELTNSEIDLDDPEYQDLLRSLGESE